MARFGSLDTQYFDAAGDPLVAGKIYFYESGTTTLKTTFADINQSIPNTNPVILTAAGRQPNIFFEGVAKAVLTNSSDVQIVSRDPVGETTTNFGDAWISTRIYGANDVVIGSDGVYYRSLLAGNQNHNPTSTTGYWVLLYSVEWSSGITYKVGAVVTYEGNTYQSLQNSNLNQNPASVTAYWTPLAFAWLATRTYAIGENAVGTDGVLYTSLQNANIGNVPASSAAYWVGTSAAAAASATASAASAAAALVSENASAASESAAATSATNSGASATASAASASASATSAAASDTARIAAQAAKVAAELAETNSETAETNSAASASASATSAAASLVSQNAAAGSATAAAASASAAGGSSGTATTKAAEAAASAAAALVSENAASASASTASTQAGIATTKAGESATSAIASASSATASANSATAAAGSATTAAATLVDFEELYLGAKSTAPTVDNQGNALVVGALYFNTVSNTMFVYSGSSWAAAGSAVNGTAERQEYTATSGQTTFAATYDVGFVDVYLNGSRLVPTTDFTASNGAQVVLTTGATTGDNVGIIAYGAFSVADVYTQAQSNARFLQIANNLSDLASAPTALTNLGLTATAAELNYTDGVTSNIQTQLDAAGVGSVTSVGGTGSVSGLTLTGTVTSSGNLTLGGTLDDINLASGVTGTLPVANGGTGAATLTANNVLLGNGTSAPLAVAPSTSGNVLTSNGTTWQSTTPAGGGGWELITTVSGTNSLTFLLSNVLSDSYYDYIVEGNLDVANGVYPNPIGFEFQKSGGTYQTSDYATYFWGSERTGTSIDTGTGSTNYYNLSGTYLTPNPIYLRIHIARPQTASGGNAFIYVQSEVNALYSTPALAIINNGGVSVAADYTGLRIKDYRSGPATFTGSIRVWGRKTS